MDSELRKELKVLMERLEEISDDLINSADTSNGEEDEDIWGDYLAGMLAGMLLAASDVINSAIGFIVDTFEVAREDDSKVGKP